MVLVRAAGSRRAAILAAVAIAVAGCDGFSAATTPPLTTVGSSPAATIPGPSSAPTAGQRSDAPGPTGTPGPMTGGGDPNGVALTLEPVVRLDGPALAMAAPDDGSGRLFVATQDGLVWSIAADGTVPRAPLLDLGARVISAGERGLLGIATHPGFATDPRLFLDYTDRGGDTVVASVLVDRLEPGQTDLRSLQPLLRVDQPFSNHNGGALAFGPDGFLYVSLGDGGAGGDPLGSGQSRSTLLGKILRLDVDQPGPGAGYGIPADNPFAAGGGLPEIWHYGLRNPWRMSFDRSTGDLWIGDVGQGRFEEVDVARAGARGLNFGWNVLEGSHCYEAESCDATGMTAPVSDYGRELGCTVIGGYVYRGAAQPHLQGVYVFADACSGSLFGLDAASDALTPPVRLAGEGTGRIVGFGEDASGELYALALDGQVSRVLATAR